MLIRNALTSITSLMVPIYFPRLICSEVKAIQHFISQKLSNLLSLYCKVRSLKSSEYLRINLDGGLYQFEHKHER